MRESNVLALSLLRMCPFNLLPTIPAGVSILGLAMSFQRNLSDFKKKIHPWSDALVISYLNYLTYRAYDYLPGLFLEQYFGLKTRGLKRQSSHWRTMGTSSIRLAKFQLFTWYLASLFFLPSILLYSFLHLLFRVLFFMIFFYDILFNNLFNICRFVRIGPYSH